ncbi:MAG: class I SAM-dependent methyltransferase [Candidatus Aminicenantes bacterium]|nr:class I SAM-dependent methyltransferase [Candidatus Aminicenantes bacterium]
MTLRDFAVKLIWGNRVYSLFMAPFDRYTVDVKPSSSFPTDTIALNKLCRLADSRNAAWAKGFSDLLFPSAENIFHRKIWEFNQIIHGLRRLRRLSPDAVALGIGCGHEELMYFLATRLKMVYATDLYQGGYLGDEGADDVLLHPDKYAPFRYPEDRLRVLRMDARELSFEDGTFDIVFSLSALEHFGRKADKRRALKEMNRVLKPGGVAALTTELILNRLGWRRDYFKIRDLTELIGEAGFALSGPLDLGIEEEFASPPVAFPHEVFRTPHVIVRLFHAIFTSLSVFLVKPGDPAGKGRALIGEEADAPTKPYLYKAGWDVVRAPARVDPGSEFSVSLKIRNEGDAIWYHNSSRSHRVRIGVWATAEDGANLTGEPIRFSFPRNVKPGDEVMMDLNLPSLAKEGSLRLQIDLVKEYYFWFRDKGSPLLAIPIVSG